MLINLNFIQLILNQSIFQNNTTGIIITSHIDDLLVYEPNIEDIQALKTALSKKIETTDLSKIFYYLDIEVIRDRAKKSLCMSQRKFIKKLLNKFQKSNLRSIKTPAEQGVRLEKYDQNATKADIKLYQQQIRFLMYLMTLTRLYLLYIVGLCARFISNLGPTIPKR